MKRLYILAFCSVIFFSLLYYFTKPQKLPAEEVLAQYRGDIVLLYEAVSHLYTSIEAEDLIKDIREQFNRSREAYKKIEWLAEYYNSYTTKQINGPAVKEVEAEDKQIVIEPEGFQVVEELLYPAYRGENKIAVLRQVAILQSNIKRLQLQASSIVITDAHIFDALRLEVFRIISLGITGFDSPIAKNSISEAASSLQSIGKIYTFYSKELSRKDKVLDLKLQRVLREAESFVTRQNDFDSFDRATFISTYANAVSESFVIAQQRLLIPFLMDPRALSSNAATLFSKKVFNPAYFSADMNSHTDFARVNLGKKIFSDGILSGNEKVSCASCHQPQKAFTDGLVTSKSVTGIPLKRNTPTLINSALQPSLFYDSRVAYLEDQANEVIINRDEMHGSFDKILSRINSDPQYKKEFARIYKENKLTDYQIRNVLSSYIRSLVMLDSRFDRYMRGAKEAMNTKEISGFNLFMGKAKCATCHFIPLFNGTNPPLFNKIDAEVIGVPSTKDTANAILDEDLGKYHLYKIPLHKNAFKTPGLRNIALTAPYMHNGVYETLEEVVGFYNRGGGSGLGFEIPNLTLQKDKLQLSSAEQKALVSFLHTLTDTSSSVNRKYLSDHQNDY